MRSKRRDALPSLSRPVWALGVRLGDRHADPELGIVRVGLCCLAKVPRGFLVRALVHRAVSARDGPGDATGQDERTRQPPQALTPGRGAETMPAMTRDTLASILARADGVTLTDGRFEVGEKHHLSVYVGQPGQAMVMSDIAKGELVEGFLEIVTRETRTKSFLAYDAVHAVSTRPPDEEEKRRAGFA